MLAKVKNARGRIGILEMIFVGKQVQNMIRNWLQLIYLALCLEHLLIHVPSRQGIGTLLSSFVSLP